MLKSKGGFEANVFFSDSIKILSGSIEHVKILIRLHADYEIIKEEVNLENQK